MENIETSIWYFGKTEPDILENIFTPLLEEKKVSIDFKKIGAPKILGGKSESSLKNIIYYCKTGTKWVPLDFKEICRKFKEVLDELNLLLLKEGKSPIKMTSVRMQDYLSEELRFKSTKIGLPKEILDKVVLIFSDRFLIFDKLGNFILKKPDELELWSRTSLPYKFSEEFTKPLLWEDLSNLKKGDNPIFDWLMLTSGNNWDSQDVWDYTRFRLQTWGLILTSSIVGTDRVFIPFGKTNTGKSGEIAILQDLVGKDNYATLQLDELADRFQLPQLEGYMANLPDDSGITRATVGAQILGILKGIIAFKEFNLNPKGQFPRKAVLKIRPWFPTNDLPEIPATSNELYSRVIVLPFDVDLVYKKKYNEKKGDFYKKLISENRDILRRMALGGLLDYIKLDQSFVESKKVIEATYSYLDNLKAKYADGQNFVQLGVGRPKDFVIDRKKVLKKGSRRFRNIYDMYANWCKNKRLYPLDKNDFEKSLLTFFKEEIVPKGSTGHRKYLLI